MARQSHSTVWKGIFLLIGLVITFRAVYLLWNDDYPLFSLTLLVFTAGSILFTYGTPPPIPWADLPSAGGMSARQKGLILISLAGSLVAFLLFWFGGGSASQFAGFPFWVWLLSLFTFWLAVEGPGPLKLGEWKKFPWLEILLLVFVLSVAFFLRTYRLDIFPNGCQTDECNNGLDALKWLNGKPYTPYAVTNEGQATLFTYMLALSFKFFGVGVAQMRLVSAIIGTLTIAAFYLLARDWLEWRFAMAATALFAVARWHLTFSRIVYELILTPLAEILVFLFFLRALKNGRLRYWAIAGLCLAFGMNTYTGFRIIPVVIAVYLLYWLVTHRARIRRDVEGIVYMGLGAWVGMTPLTVYVLQNWDVFMGRTRHISIFNDIANAGGSWLPFWKNIIRTLLSFHWQGDMAPLNNLPGEPLLDVIVGTLILFGLAYAIRHIRHPLGFLYLTWVLAGLSLAVFSSVNESPTARRPIGLLPVIFLMAGTVLQLTWQTLRETLSSIVPALSQRFRHVLAVGEGLLLGAVVFGVAVINIDTYLAQSANRFVWHAYSATEAAIGEYLYDLPQESRVYLDPTFNKHSAILFISRDRPYTVLNLSAHLPMLTAPVTPADMVYVFHPLNGYLQSLITGVYPGGVWEAHKSPFGDTLFYTFEIPAESMQQANWITGEYFRGTFIAGEPIVTRLDAPLDFQWDSAEEPPLPAPFSAQWNGSIHLPEYREYEFAIQTDGAATLLIDGKPVLEMLSGGQKFSASSVLLTAGFHAFSLTYHSGAAPGKLSLLWKDSDGNFVPVPRHAFFPPVLARNGLTGYYYSNETMTDPYDYVRRDLFIMPDNSRLENFSIVWKGRIKIPVSGEYVFGCYADDGASVYVDGEQIAGSEDGQGVRDVSGKVTLETGFHNIEVHYWQLKGAWAMRFWWHPPGGARQSVPLEYLFPEDEPFIIKP